MVTSSSHTFTALPDPPEVGDANPVHKEGATEFGYEGGIVAGIHTYGWMVPAILDALGDRWMSDGWAEFAFKRPVYAGEELTSTVVPAADDPTIGMIEQITPEGKVTIDGRVGLGRAPWADEFDLPSRRAPEPAVERGPFLLPEQVPTGTDYPPMEVSITADEAREWVRHRLGIDDARWMGTDSEPPIVHPSWTLGQMTPLIRHSYRMPAGVHATGRVQHLAEHRAGDPVVVAGRWGTNRERKGKWWSTTDAVFLGADGTELAHVRQVAVILPPPPR